MRKSNKKAPSKEGVIKKVKPIKGGGKKYNAYFLESDSKKYRMWFDFSSAKIPLRIDGAVGFGNTKMIMNKYEIVKELSWE